MNQEELDKQPEQDDELNIDPFATDFDESTDAGDETNTTTGEVFDAQSLSDGPLSNYAAENAPQITDERYPRYGMSGLLPIPLYRQNGNNSYGDFNKKNAAGQNIVNNDYFPPFQLIPFYGGSFPVPYENQPTESEEPIAPAPFDYDVFKAQPKNGYERVTRTAKQCADVFMLECRRSGAFIFDSLTGYHLSDRDQGLQACRELVDLCMPIGDKKIFGVLDPKTGEYEYEVRVKNGIPFKGPFLKDLLAFVNTESTKRIQASSLSPADKETALKFALELRNMLRTGVQMANTFLNETEAEMKNPNELKQSYDPPNLEVPNAPVSTDSYCLAHTDRIELDDKQLAASENIGKGLSEPMANAVHSLAEIAKEMRDSRLPAQTSGKVMSIEDVKALLDEQAKELTAAFDEKLASAAAAGQSGDATITEPAATDPPIADDKGSKTKTK